MTWSNAFVSHLDLYANSVLLSHQVFMGDGSWLVDGGFYGETFVK